MLIIVLVFCFLIFPLLISFKIKYYNNKKFEIKILFFNLIKIFTIRIYINSSGIYICFLRKKIFKSYKDILKKKKVSSFSFINIISVKSNVYFYPKNNDYCLLIFLLYVINQFVCGCITHNKPYLTIKNNFYLSNEKQIINAEGKIKIIFNLLSIIIFISNLIMEKILYEITRKNKSDNRNLVKKSNNLG